MNYFKKLAERNNRKQDEKYQKEKLQRELDRRREEYFEKAQAAESFYEDMPVYNIRDGFYENLDSLTAVQYYRFSAGLTLSNSLSRVDLKDNAEAKEKITELLKKTRIDSFTEEDLYLSGAYDMHRWKLFFKVDKPDRVYALEGYAKTEKTAPFFSELSKYLEIILTEREKAERQLELERISRYME